MENDYPRAARLIEDMRDMVRKNRKISISDKNLPMLFLY